MIKFQNKIWKLKIEIYLEIVIWDLDFSARSADVVEEYS